MADSHTHSPRYFCHACGREVPIYMAPDPTCQVCNEQFIEEVDDDTGDDPRSFLGGGGGGGADGQGDEDIFQFFRGALGNQAQGPQGGTARFHFTTPDTEGGGEAPASMSDMLQNIFSTILSGNLPQQQQQQQGQHGQQGQQNRQDDHDGHDHDHDHNPSSDADQHRRRTPMIIYSGVMDGNMQFRPINVDDGQQQGTQGRDGTTYFHFSSTSDNNTTQTQQDQQRNDFGNSFQGIMQLLSTLTGTSMDAGLAGNPNDYVFSQAALDNIITQLMEQTGGRTAPPPAPEDVIAGLPRRALTPEEFKEQADCSVCKDEFNAAEIVTELPCQHIFHDDCIKPWLKVNGTCPVCRHSVITTEHDDEAHAPSADDHASSQDDHRTPAPGSSSSPHNAPTSSSAPPGDGGAGSSSSTSNTSNTTRQAHADASIPDNQRTRSSPIPSSFSWFSGNGGTGVRPAAAPGTWPANIPGAFSWGPGQNQQQQSQQQQQQQQRSSPRTPSSEAHNETHMDLDLD